MGRDLPLFEQSDEVWSRQVEQVGRLLGGQLRREREQAQAVADGELSKGLDQQGEHRLRKRHIRWAAFVLQPNDWLLSISLNGPQAPLGRVNRSRVSSHRNRYRDRYRDRLTLPSITIPISISIPIPYPLPNLLKIHGIPYG